MKVFSLKKYKADMIPLGSELPPNHWTVGCDGQEIIGGFVTNKKNEACMTSTAWRVNKSEWQL